MQLNDDSFEFPNPPLNETFEENMPPNPKIAIANVANAQYEREEERKWRRKLFFIVLGSLAVLTLFIGSVMGVVVVSNLEASTKSPTNAPTTSAPTKSPTTSAPTTSPTLNPTQSPTPPTESPTSAPTPFQLFPQEVRVGDDEDGYISLLFLNDPGPEVFQSFVNGAERWSAVLEGSQELLRGSSDPNMQNIKSYENLCNESLDLEDVNVDHLRVIVRFSPLEGALTRTDQCAFENGLPAVGILFASDSLADNLLNFMDTIVAHELGHLLGFGRLWKENELIENATIDLDGNIFPENQPEFIGLAARQAYQAASSDSSLPDFVPVDDRVTNGVRTQDPEVDDSIFFDEHWDPDFILSELMGPSIAPFEPLSAITIGSMEDLGYFVNYSLADEFDQAIPFVAANSGEPSRRVSDEDILFLH